jgi:hypothetical protein
MTWSCRLSRTVDAPCARARKDEQQEYETIQDGRIAAIERRVWALGSMKHPIGHRHLAGEKEGDGPGEPSDQEQKASDELEDSADSEEREEWRHSTLRGSRKAEQLLRSVFHKDQRRDDPQDGQGVGRPTVESSGHANKDLLPAVCILRRAQVSAARGYIADEKDEHRSHARSSSSRLRVDSSMILGFMYFT